MIITYVLNSSHNNGEVQSIAQLETVYGKAKEVFTYFFANSNGVCEDQQDLNIVSCKDAYALLCNEDRLVESNGFDA